MQASIPGTPAAGAGASDFVPTRAGGVAFVAPPPELRNAYHPSLTVWSDEEWFISFDLGTSTETVDYHTRGLRTIDGGATWCDEGPLLVKPESEVTTHTLRTRRLDGRRQVPIPLHRPGAGGARHRRAHRRLSPAPRSALARFHGRWQPCCGLGTHPREPVWRRPAPDLHLRTFRGRAHRAVAGAGPAASGRCRDGAC